MRGLGEDAIERRGLVGILAVAQVIDLDVVQRQQGWELLGRGLAQEGGDGRVVSGGEGEGLGGELGAEGAGGLSVVRSQLLDDPLVERGRRRHGDPLEVLRRRSDHAGPADVDVLDGVVLGAVGLEHGLLEGVEIHADKIDGLDRVFSGLRLVLRIIAQGEQAAVHFGVQGLDASRP
jgi:hypothetical protein